MTVKFNFNWKMLCFGGALYSEVKCFEVYLGPVVIGIWWGLA